MANTLLELLSLPIVDKDGNASQYFEDAWYELIQSLGGENGDSPVDLANIQPANLKPSVSALGRRIADLEQQIKNNSNLSAKVNSLVRDVEDIKQQIQRPSLRAKINRIDRDLKDIAQQTG